ncbi:MAG TPA: hydroxymethylpyrimidine/phosphomethylpyrimidine kinase [Steroidobacteraceae bacterium]|nr:hydroxymethylpyrimidine/phosphomethylpyrimidine kinase [Steroidobacteraceae bacterium]
MLVIAGTDSSGGAGLTRDVATLTQLRTEALCAVTAVTAQTDAAVTAVGKLPASLVSAQIAAAIATARVRAVKIGMLADAGIVAAVSAALPPREGTPLVLDPVLAASSGGELLDAAGRAALRRLLLPRTTLLTPNLGEAAVLLDAAAATGEEAIVAQGRALCALGALAVLMKGGHAGGPLAIDWLVTAEGGVESFSAPRLPVAQRGTGCALASAIAAGLAMGLGLAAACAQAKRHVTEMLRQAG